MRHLLMLCVFSLLTACVSIQTDSARNVNMKEYKRAYLQPQQEDEFQIYRALFWELNDMGLDVVGAPFQEPTAQDLIVTYSYDGGWDITRYLQSFQIRFMNSKTNQVIVTTSYKSKGLWHGVRDGRLEEAFNDVRSKFDLPPTTQFSGKSQ